MLWAISEQNLSHQPSYKTNRKSSGTFHFNLCNNFVFPQYNQQFLKAPHNYLTNFFHILISTYSTLAKNDMAVTDLEKNEILLGPPKANKK